MGNGILVAGGVGNTIERNLVYDHDRTGIGLVPFPEEDANDGVPDRPTWDDARAPRSATTRPRSPTPPTLALVLWDAMENTVVGNEVSGSGLADLAVGSLQPDLAGLDNCFSDNTFATSAPLDLEALAPCDGEPDLGRLGRRRARPRRAHRRRARRRRSTTRRRPTPEPPDQPNMPDAETAPARPATDVPVDVDLDAIAVPDPPDE